MRYVRRGGERNRAVPSSNDTNVLFLSIVSLAANLFIRVSDLLSKLILLLVWLYYLLNILYANTQSTRTLSSIIWLVQTVFIGSCEFIASTDEPYKKRCFMIDKPYFLLLGGSTLTGEVPLNYHPCLPAGLDNSGNTCFLAAATQLLITIPSIRRLVQVFVFYRRSDY